MWRIDVTRTHHPCMKIDMNGVLFLMLIVKPILLGDKKILLYIRIKMQVGSESRGQTQRNCEVSLEIQVVEFFLSLVAFSFYLIFCA